MPQHSGKQRQANLRTALGFLRLKSKAPELTLLHRWPDSWSGIGLVAVGMYRQEAARPFQLQLQTVVARTGADLESAFSAMARAHAEAVFVILFGSYIAARQLLAELAVRNRLPTMFGLRDHVEAGGLMSYGVDFRDLMRRGAIYVDKILRGAKPGELPVEQSSKFELVINLKTAKALGLTIPPSLLARADQIIE